MVRINGGSPLGGIQKTSSGTGKAKTSANKKSASHDRIQVSDAATLREMAHTMMADMPEVRLERIEEIRDALEGGSFQYNSKKVAAQIVLNAMAEHVWD